MNSECLISILTKKESFCSCRRWFFRIVPSLWKARNSSSISASFLEWNLEAGGVFSYSCTSAYRWCGNFFCNVMITKKWVFPKNQKNIHPDVDREQMFWYTAINNRISACVTSYHRVAKHISAKTLSTYRARNMKESERNRPLCLCYRSRW